MPLSSNTRARKYRVPRQIVAGWVGVFLGCAGLWAGEALIHHADIQARRSRCLANYHPAVIPSRHDDSLAFAKAEIETARHIALILGGIAWFVAMLTMFFARPWRRQIAQVCLAGALLSATAWSVSPTRSWGRPSLIAPLPIGIASAGLIGLLAFIIPVRCSVRRASDCVDCGYDLTGNRSGICPECGRPTVQKLADRWQGQAEQLLAVACDESRECVIHQAAVQTDRYVGGGLVPSRS